MPVEIFLVFIFGLVMGSFLNVCVYRIPRNIFFSASRSFCPQCHKIIPWDLNIPLLSVVYVGGQSFCCQKKISYIYPLVEFLTGILFVILYWKYPFILHLGNIVEIHEKDILRFNHGIILISYLLTISFIDLECMIIPDKLSFPMMAIAPFMAILHPELTLKSSLLGILLGGGSLYLVSWLYWLVRKEIGLGFGDVKLLMVIGGWLGLPGVLPTILYGSLIGALFGITLMIIKRSFHLKSSLPFGPFLSLGAWLHFMWGMEIQNLILKV